MKTWILNLMTGMLIGTAAFSMMIKHKAIDLRTDKTMLEVPQ